jgi:hypothetical protein
MAKKNYNKLTGTNPKDLVGANKVSISSVPLASQLHEAMAMMNGAKKYGPYNWRDNPVQARIYIDAALRHIGLWLEGEEYSPDTNPPVHHLGHAKASLGIILDALETGNLVDDRPLSGSKNVELMDRLNKQLSEKRNEDKVERNS